MNIYARFIKSTCLLILLSLCGLGLLAMPALAQEADAQGSIAGINYDDVPDAYIAEAQRVYQTCTSNHTQRSYFDCQCYSMEYLKERLYLGPTRDEGYIRFKLSKKCRDATEAAGAEYQRCLNSNANMQPGTDPEALCSCVANTFAKMVEFDAPTLQSSTLSPYKVRARLMCGNPALARKLLGRAAVIN